MKRLAAGLVTAGAVLLAAPGVASAGRVAVGLRTGADASAVSAAVERRGGRVTEDLAPIPALVVDVPSSVSISGIRGIRYVEPLVSRRLALTPTDPFVSRQWYLTQSRFYESWITYPAFESIPVADHRLGSRCKPPRAGRPHPRGEELRGRFCTCRCTRARNIRRGPHRGQRGQRSRHRRPCSLGAAARGKGRHERSVDTHRRRGPCDPLGGRARRARDQHEPRRATRSARSESRQLLAARGGCRSVRGPERSGCRGRGRKRRPGADEPLELRQLSRGLATCPRSELGDSGRTGSQVLEPRSDLQRPGGPRGRDPVHVPAVADLALSGVFRARVLELWAGRLPGGAGHVVLGAPGERCRGDPPEPAPAPSAGAGHGDPATHRCRCRRGNRLSDVCDRPRRSLGLGTARRGSGDRGSFLAAACT